MNKEFCMICGFRNDFSVTKPRFCGGCSNPLNTTLAVASVPSKKVIVPEEEEESGFDIESIDIDQLRRSIAVESRAHKVSLNDLWSAPAPADPTRRPSCGEVADKSLLRKIEKECGASTSKEIDG